jgi:hypothetical protein
MGSITNHFNEIENMGSVQDPGWGLGLIPPIPTDEQIMFSFLNGKLPFGKHTKSY